MLLKVQKHQTSSDTFFVKKPVVVYSAKNLDKETFVSRVISFSIEENVILFTMVIAASSHKIINR